MLILVRSNCYSASEVTESKFTAAAPHEASSLGPAPIRCLKCQRHTMHHVVDSVLEVLKAAHDILQELKDWALNVQGSLGTTDIISYASDMGKKLAAFILHATPALVQEGIGLTWRPTANQDG